PLQRARARHQRGGASLAGGAGSRRRGAAREPADGRARGVDARARRWGWWVRWVAWGLPVRRPPRAVPRRWPLGHIPRVPDRRGGPDPAAHAVASALRSAERCRAGAQSCRRNRSVRRRSREERSRCLAIAPPIVTGVLWATVPVPDPAP